MSSTEAGYAILGAGIFAKTAYLPALAQFGAGGGLKAVYSRSESSTRGLASLAQEKLGLSAAPAVYYDSPSPPAEASLDALLAREDIKAVLVVLPITTQPKIILKALEAGKHVLSEKPVAPDVKAAKALIAAYERTYKHKGIIWRVAENYEAEAGYQKVGELVKGGKIGDVTGFRARIANHMKVDNEYYKTPWRTVPDYQGGFLLDGGVHNAAVLRVILPSPLVSLTGYAALHREFLAPHDTIHAVARTANGASGTFELTFAAPSSELSATNGYTIIGSKGFLHVRTADGKHNIEVHVNDAETETMEITLGGVEEELKSFLKAAGGEDDGTQDPRSALKDLAFIEAALTSDGSAVDLSALGNM
ncbi:oxidoreductase family protein [Peniophora sp. CONT]|nr:oxidoreductase family protein [Peniophora sp. CONT]